MGKKTERAISLLILLCIVLSIALGKVYNNVSLYVLSILLTFLLSYLLIIKGYVFSVLKDLRLSKSYKMFYCIIISLLTINVILNVSDSKWLGTFASVLLVIANSFIFIHISLKKIGDNKNNG